jgi:hypothetical protein
MKSAKTQNLFYIITTCFIAMIDTVNAQTDEQITGASYIFRHVNLVTMKDDHLLKDQIVIIKGDIISFIGKDNFPKKIRTKATVTDGSNKYLMPALADMHCHFPEGNEIKKYLLLNFTAGVTTLRSMKGQEDNLSKYTEGMTFPVPDLYRSGLVYKKMNLTIHNIDSLVASYKNQGFDFIKVFSLQDTSLFQPLMNSAKHHNLPVCGHYLKNVGMKKLLTSGYSSIEHLDGQQEALDQGEEYFNEIISLSKKHNVYHCPTLDWYQHAYSSLTPEELKQRRGLEYIPDSTKQTWDKDINDTQKGDPKYIKHFKSNYQKLQEKQFKILKSLADAGVNILTGVDAGGQYSVPGFSIIEEMRLLNQAGLSNYQVLQTATISAARYLNQDKNSGTLEAGKRASLIVLSENPLEKLDAIQTIEAVMHKSKYYSTEDLKTQLNEISQRYKTSK